MAQAAALVRDMIRKEQCKCVCFVRSSAAIFPATKVYEDDQFLAFKDLNPVAPVHFLVVPKAHIENVNAITADNSAVVARIFFETIPQIAALPRGLPLTG